MRSGREKKRERKRNVPSLRKLRSQRRSRAIRFCGYFFSITRIATYHHELRNCVPRCTLIFRATRRVVNTPLSCPFLYERGRGERKSRYARSTTRRDFTAMFTTDWLSLWLSVTTKVVLRIPWNRAVISDHAWCASGYHARVSAGLAWSIISSTISFDAALTRNCLRAPKIWIVHRQ